MIFRLLSLFSTEEWIRHGSSVRNVPRQTTLTHHSWQRVHRFGNPPLSPPHTPTTTATSPFRSGAKTTRINTTISAFAFQNKTIAGIFGLAAFHRLRSKSRKTEGLIKRTDTKGCCCLEGFEIGNYIALGFPIMHYPRV